MSIREALREGSARLKKAATTPSLDVSLLLAKVLDIDRARLLLIDKDTLSNEAWRRFGELLKRRLEGECVAYILGHKEFRGLDFLVNPAVLVPRPDTETLVDAALETIRRRSAGIAAETPAEATRLLDLCTGSGAVAIALKHEIPGLEVWASDNSREALETARINAARLLPDPAPRKSGEVKRENPEQAGIRFVESDLFANIPGRFHIIVSNPPYVPSGEIKNLSPEVRREPRPALDGGSDGLDLIRPLIGKAPEHLYPGGAVFIEADPRQMAALAVLLEKSDFKDIHSYRDLSGKERIIGAVL
ncbi:MAG: peptide chain release factor N(5)-glutamine methyltransferase [Treponema sp.]|jgi:release factor glutamine methyltransferase|nr:peptide chain release factor N(5)-glutamine methyltransferase [Treponema sp.]